MGSATLGCASVHEHRLAGKEAITVELIIGRLSPREDAANSRELAYVRQQVAEINDQLQLADLPTVDEPDGTGEPPTVVAVARNGIARLQRLAAHTWYWHQRVPAPLGPDEPPVDDHVRWYRESEGELWGGVFGQYIARDNMRRRRFDHLVLHDASAGFYVPVQFGTMMKLRPVVRAAEPSPDAVPERQMPRTLGKSNIGSSFALAEELDRLHEAIHSAEEPPQPDDIDALEALQTAARASIGRGAILFVL
jgi:hypothetical protein